MANVIEADVIVRPAAESDLARLCELEELGPTHGRASKQQIRKRLKGYPSGQYVLEHDARVVGAIYTQRIANADALPARSAANVESLHDPAGGTVLVLGTIAAPQIEGRRLRQALQAFLLEECRKLGVERLVEVVACASVDGTAPRADDPVLALHASRGATIGPAIPKYRPRDVANHGYGVLVSYEVAPSRDGRLFVLSAANRERLQAYAAKVAGWLEQSPADLRFDDAIYTWQVARTPMKCRLAMRVEDAADLRAKLARWLADPSAVADAWTTDDGRDDPKEPRPSDGEGGSGLEDALAAADWRRLGAYWTAGAPIEWAKLYPSGAVQPRRIGVPTYPFAKERHWIDAGEAATPAAEPAVVPPAATAPRTVAAPLETVLATPVWEAAPPSAPEDLPPAADERTHRILLCEMAGVDAERLASLVPGSECAHLTDAPPRDIDARFAAHAVACFERLRAMFLDESPRAAHVQIVIPDECETALAAGLSGMLKSAAEEHPRFVGQIVLTDATTPEALAEQLRRELGRPEDALVRYDGLHRQVLRWRAVRRDDTRTDTPVAFESGGVYLITGGLGGLGMLFAREILRNAAGAKIVLSGRAPLSAERQTRLAELAHEAAQYGAAVEYGELDLTNRDAVAQFVAGVHERYGRLDGILHSAGMTADSRIAQKSVASLEQVLAPKVAGTVNLDSACRCMNLDFFVMFSSAISVFGNPGQADYAAANGFMDQFAAYRNRLVDFGRRRGQTVSINWPMWREGGMTIDPAGLETLRRLTGVQPLRTAPGLQTFHDAVAAKSHQLMVLEGARSEIEAALARATLSPRAGTRPQAGPALDAGRLQAATIGKLRQLFAEITKRPAAKIDEREELASYGIDSIIISHLNLALTGVFGEISKTLFFECKTLEEAAAYLVGGYPAACAAWAGLDRQDALGPGGAPAAALVPAAPAAERAASPTRADDGAGTRASAAVRDESIAVVGVSGIYPLAADIDEFWRNLSAGRDCIREVPNERWRLEGFYTPDLEEALEQGKSYSKWGGFIDEFADFDPLFFKISPREALNIDPQERLFLQECWRAMEHAGYTRRDLKQRFGQRVGVFAGVTKTGYHLYALHGRRTDEPFFPYTSFSAIANRVSYFFDITGPSMPIDTMCSSSLVAIHEACEHLRRGECDLAFAGGVNLYLHPQAYRWLCSQQMLSRDGLCRSFGAGGNGFVPGEGVGVVLLKPLSHAIRDRDTIHGVILATHVNHGGKTNALTVPSPKAQAEVIRGAIDKAGIRATDIGYVEAHGTGTELGDPIEISGLQQAFAPDDPSPGQCKIGSAKSNIGHLEAAAGVAGLTKVLLQMKHGQIAPSLHAMKLNPNIAFERTPFRVNTSLSHWQPAAAADGTRGPRIAGISSFGAAGANAHVIVQEYVAAEHAAPKRADGELAVVPLSARTAAELERRVRDLLRFIRAKPATIDLAALAYTLQVGREAMDERLACLVSSVEELADKLVAHLGGQLDVEGLYRAQVEGKDALRLFDDEDFKSTLEKWIERRKLVSLAELWTRGLDFDWTKLYGDAAPPRLALPTYPFAKERYWIDAVVEPAQAPSRRAAVLHPLLHANTSTLEQHGYTSVFDGEEFFLRDHEVRGERTLPAAAYLEMARAAVALAAPAASCGAPAELRDVAWTQPITVSAPKEVRIALRADGAGGVEFEVESASASAARCPGAGDGAAPVVHAQGRAVFTDAPPPPDLDVAALQARMGRGGIDTADLYRAFHDAGIRYGDAHRAVGAVRLGDSELVAELALPGSLETTRDDYWLHPSLLDGALQATIGLLDAPSGAPRRPMLPFALEALRVFAPCSRHPVAWVRRAASDEATRFDIDLADRDGKICAQLRGFSLRPLDAEIESRADAAQSLHTLAPVWDRISRPTAQKTRAGGSRVLLVGGPPAALDWLRKSYDDARQVPLAAPSAEAVHDLLKDRPFDHLVWIAPDAIGHAAAYGDVVERQEQGVLAVFRLAKALAIMGHGDRCLRWTLITRNTRQVKAGDDVAPAHAAIAGLVGSLAKECPDWDLRLVDVDDLCAVTAEECLGLAADKNGDGLAFRDGEWYREGLAQLLEQPESPPAYRQGGVYVVVGGAGGIGEAWSRYMVERYHARLIWIGRRPLDASIEAKIRSIAELGPAPVYLSANATDVEALRLARERIAATYPAIHGVVHSAIDLKDRSVARMDETTFRKALAAKVDISVNLDAVFGELDLDFMLFFSSLISFTKGVGQANYAAGCTFKDSFARALARRRPYPVKVMNWGYWGNTGVVTADFYNKRMQQMGIGSIEAGEAMRSLESLVSGELPQIALLKTLSGRAIDDLARPQSLRCLPQRAASVLPQARQVFDGAFKRKSPEVLQRDLLCRQPLGLATDLLASTLAALVRDRRATMDSAHTRWHHTSVDYLREHPHTVRALDELWAEWDAKKVAWAANPRVRAQIALLEACLRALPEILTGKRAATDVIFPGSSMQLVEGVYQGHTLADYCNDALGGMLVAGIECKQLDHRCGVRILEIGAGTGGTTARLLPMLRNLGGAVLEYCYTDLSKAFLMHAEERYQPQLPALTTAIFDVAKPLAGQAVTRAGYDFVIATNVLHATRDIRETLRNAKALLKNQGVLLLNEMSRWTLFSHLTFGLLEGWWLFEDRGTRLRGSPGLAPKKWRAVLEEEGFEHVSFPVKETHALGQQVIAASSDGKIRQPLTAARLPITMPAAAHPPAAPAHPTFAVGAAANGAPAARGVPAAQVANGDAALRERCVAYLQGIVAKTLRIAPSELAPSRPLAEYGLDSILVVGLTNQLRKAVPGIASTLFFEVRNIAGLADYLLRSKREQVEALLGASELAISTSTAAAAPAPAHSPAVPAVRELAAASAVPSRAARAASAPTSSGPKGANGHAAIAGDDFAAALTAHRAPVPAANAATPAAIFDVAIVGVSGRYPQSPTLRALWENLAAGRNCVTEIPADRWDWRDYYDPEKGKAGKTYTKWGGFLERIDCFDPLFFKISPKEAKAMDPQERLFLECCYHAIEDAGYTPATLGDTERIGVFAGVMNARYNAQPLYYSIANRVSFALNFQGPSMAVDTACSSSLTAIHLALESLYGGSTECAIAGGVNLIVDPGHYLDLSSLTMLSAGGECRSFGDGADGFVDAEGVGAVVLKPLAHAERDGDHIYAVIKASAVNAGGKTHGYTVPNPSAQSAVVAKALERAGVDPAAVSYVEAHGTGTALGDPIEIAALRRVFQASARARRCAIGSLKSNIGHCESAAGIAALSKVLLMLEHRQLVPSLHADATNREIDFAETPFAVQRTLEDWVVEHDAPRIAGISSFGAGGANAHLVVQEYVAPTREAATRSTVVVPLSARTAEQLEEQARQLLQFLDYRKNSSQNIDITDISYTLQVGRESFEERAAWVVDSPHGLERALRAYIEGVPDGERRRGTVKRYAEPATFDPLGAADPAMLATAWAVGTPIDWNLLYDDANRPRRIGLPGYPFARERYWRDRSLVRQSATAPPARDSVLHPLLHRNVSMLRQQRYVSVFTGDEPFLGDGWPGDDAARELPAVACLEMARAAIDDAVPRAAAARELTFVNVQWSDAVPVTHDRPIFVALFERAADEIGFEIYGSDDDIVHCQGSALLGHEPARRSLDVDTLKSRLRARPDADAHSRQLEVQGVQSPAMHRALTSLYVGRDELVAELALPKTFAAGAPGASCAAGELVLHPVLMDGVLQAAADLLPPAARPSLPLALDSLHVLRGSADEMTAWIRRASCEHAGDGDVCIDVDVCDRDGNVCVEIRGIAYEHAALSASDAAQERPPSPAPLRSSAPAPEPALALTDDDDAPDVALALPQAQTFRSSAIAKPTEISLAID